MASKTLLVSDLKHLETHLLIQVCAIPDILISDWWDLTLSPAHLNSNERIMIMTNQPPIEVLRDGFLKASIWQNEGDNGSFFTVFDEQTAETTFDQLGTQRQERDEIEQ